jgi:hypothetical protein
MYSNEYTDQNFVPLGVTQFSQGRATSYRFILMGRLILGRIYRLFPKVCVALAIGRPDTVIYGGVDLWRRVGLRSYWRWKSRAAATDRRCRWKSGDEHRQSVTKRIIDGALTTAL